MSDLAELSVAELAQHCHEYDDAQHAYLEMLGGAALEAISSRIDAVLYKDEASLSAALSSATPPERAFVLDKQTKLAAFLLVSHWYENRSSATDESLRTIPYGVAYLLKDKMPILGG